MKMLTRYFTLALIASFLACAQSAWAADKPAKPKKGPKECCVTTKEAVMHGEACEKCVDANCCKKTAKAAAKSKDAKPCAKCAKKDEEKKPADPAVPADPAKPAE